MEIENAILDYKDDLLFKFYCGRDGAEAMEFRKFIIENVTGLKIDVSTTNNTEPTALTIGDKKIIMNTFIMQNDFCLDIEMQNSSFDAYQSKRFQYYACKNIVLQMIANENFNADIPLMKKLLEEKEKEFFHRMELVESKKSGEKEGFISR